MKPNMLKQVLKPPVATLDMGVHGTVIEEASTSDPQSSRSMPPPSPGLSHQSGLPARWDAFFDTKMTLDLPSRCL